jgi:predicted O-methyltransferase YrrM
MIQDHLTSQYIISQLEVPQEDSSTPIKDNEAQFIFKFIINHKIKRTLETGFAYAKSASHIIAATKQKHIAIDPFQNDYKSLGLKNIEKLGLKDYLDFREDYSHNVLPELVKKGEKFEFIFIDGDHKFDGEFVDFYFADLLLEKNGYILLHDTWMRSTRLVMEFINSNRKDYEKRPTGLKNIALYQKCGVDNRDGMFFKEFFTRKSIISYNLFKWMSNGKKSLLKSFLISLKDRIRKLLPTSGRSI